VKQFPARTQSEDALSEQLAKLGLKDGRITPPAAAEDSTDEPDSDAETETEDEDSGGDATI
jgi:hypothetical protein